MKRVLLKIVFSLFCLLTLYTNAQNSATSGTDFYLTFTKNYIYGDMSGSVSCQIRYVVPDTTYITARYGDGTYLDNNVKYAPGVYTKEVDKTKCYIVSTSFGAQTSNRYIQVTSDKEINVYAINLLKNSTDATSVLPVSILNTDYTIISQEVDRYSPGFEYANITIVAPYSGTEISIFDKNGTPIVTNHSLTGGKVYSYAFDLNVTGYSVVSNNDVAVFSSASCAQMASCGDGDHNYEQMWPLNSVGKNYFLWNLSYQCNDKIVVLATEDNTTVNKKEGNQTSTILLNKNETAEFFIGSFYQNPSTPPVKLEADKPIIIEDVTGFSPSIKWISPVEQRISNAIISPFIPTGSSVLARHLLFVMILAGTENNTIMREIRNGVTTNETLTFHSNQTDPNYKIAVKEYSAYDDVRIQLINPSGLIAYMGGYGERESYIITAGAGAFNLQAYFTIQTKTTPYVDTYYSATTVDDHTFRSEDSITVKRYVEKEFSSVRWAVNNVAYPITENTNISNQLKFPASALNPGENTISMMVRYINATTDSVYTGKVWKCFPDISATISDTICQYQSYNENNFNIPEQSQYGNFDYSTTLFTKLGCDSILNLKLTVIQALDLEMGEVPEICADDPYFYVDYSITAGELGQYSIEYNSKAISEEFENEYNINELNNTIEFKMPENVRPDYYSATINFENKACNGTLSKTIQFKVKYSSKIMEQKWNDVIALLNENYNGGYVFSEYKWFKNGKEIRKENGSYLYVAPYTLDTTAFYHAELTRVDDGVTMETCTMQPTVHFDISVYPRLVSNGQSINISVSSKAKATLWTTTGILLKTQELQAGTNNFSTLQNAGAFILLVEDENAKRNQFVIMVK